MVSDERGQALTMEAVIAGVILLSAVLFALQVTAVTPLSTSTSAQHVENQLLSTGEGALDSAAEEGALEEAVLEWDPNEKQFWGTEEETPYFLGEAPDNKFGEVLQETYGDNIAYNVNITYHNASGYTEQIYLVQGEPSDHAVSVTRPVTLSENDRLINEDGSNGQRLEAVGGDFYAEQPADADGNIYNVLRVEVVAWRI